MHLMNTRLNYIKQLNKTIEQCKPSNDSLCKGAAGLALYYGMLYKVFNQKEYAEKCEQNIQTIFNNLNNEKFLFAGTSLCNGLAGFMYTVNFLNSQNLIHLNISSEFKELEELLFQTALEQIEKDEIDYLHNAGGIICYFTQRNSKTAVKYLDKLIDALYKRAIIDDSGLRFINNLGADKDTKEYNLSLSHGLSGILLILIEAFQNSLKKTRIKKMVQQGIQYILNNQLLVDTFINQYSFYPASISVASGDKIKTQRLAWCYGDLNMVLLFQRAGTLLNNPEWINWSKDIGRFTTIRLDYEATYAKDPHFCHGTAGLMQFYHVLYNETGYSKYKTAAVHWKKQTEHLLSRELKKDEKEMQPLDSLNGLLGVALPLLEAHHNKYLGWSKVWLL